MDDPLKSCNDERSDGLERLAGGALGLIALILVSAASAVAQSAPASISTIPQPSVGHPVFDASGNTYYLSGQPTAGAARRLRFEVIMARKCPRGTFWRGASSGRS